jgi:hypothetical protein
MGQKHRLNTRYIQRQIRALGNLCTIVEVNRAFANSAYRDETETYIPHTGVYCLVNILTEQDTSVQEGEARAGDLVFNFDYSYEPYLKQMNRIIFDGRTFQISDVRRFDAIGNTTYMVECFTKKYSDGTAWMSSLSENIKSSEICVPIISGRHWDGSEDIKLTDTYERIWTLDRVYLNNANLIDVLTAIKTSPSYDWDFSTPSDYTYDSAKIEVSGGMARLKGTTPINPAGWWHFNEGSGIVAADSSGNGNTGGLYGNGVLPTWMAWKLNDCLDFHGNSYVSADNSLTLNITESISIEVWLNIHTDGNYKGIVGKNYSSSYMLSTGNDGDKAISFYYGEWQIIKLNAFTLDTWHHVIVTFDRATTTATMYIDGSVVASDPAFNPTVVGDEGVIGIAIQPYTDWDYVLDGKLDEVVIYDRALTSDEVAFRYNSGIGTEAMSGYFTDNPSIVGNIGFIKPSTPISFTETSTKPVDTEIKYHVSSDDGVTWNYWNGGAWVITDNSYTQANIASEVNTNISSLGVGGTFKFRALLNSTTGISTPLLDNIHIN